MVLFGVPVAHEDDPLRAVKSTTEIHAFVQGLFHEYENRTDFNRSMQDRYSLSDGYICQKESILLREKNSNSHATFSTRPTQMCFFGRLKN
jgi:hypothetical protein